MAATVRTYSPAGQEFWSGLLELTSEARNLLIIAPMPTREIPRDEWTPFFDFLSGMAYGWLVTVEMAQPGDEPRVRAYEVPLESIDVELGSQPGDDCIAVTLREVGAQTLTFEVRPPRAIRFREDPSGGENRLDIEAATGATTRLSFRHLPLPTQIDGMLA
jgi:hypothetical protein